jgi:23S rRNA (cytosine1962-C5)-methyltransferase
MPAPAAHPLPTDVPLVHLKYVNFGPFIYQQMIDQVTGSPADGDLVAVIDTRGEMFGWAFYNGRSQITLRMLSHRPQRPAGDEIARRIARAVSLRRETLRLEDTTEAYRLIHAEGDGLSGLIADRFGPFVVIELFSLAMYRRLHEIEDAFIDAGLSVEQFVVRADKTVCQQEGFTLGRESKGPREPAVIRENGVAFEIPLGGGHKTGFFCDQRDNRLALTALTSGKRVLDCCCYSGGFACYAATLGKAAEVTAVDLDEKALVLAGRNAELNEATIDFHHADAFDFLRRAQAAGRQWDVVVLDPSKFVRRRTEMEIGLRKYGDLNRLAAGVVAPGGVLLSCSCSGLVDQATFVDTLARSFRLAGRSGQIFRLSGAGADHPIDADAPEGLYLKAAWCRIL